MDPRTGELISVDERLRRARAGEDMRRFSVELAGPPAAIERVSAAVKADRRRRNRTARRSRRRNR